MFEDLFLRFLRNSNNLYLILFTIILVVFLGFVNSFFGNNFFLLMGFVSLAMAFPIIKYIKEMDNKELYGKISTKRLFFEYDKEILLFWSIFLGFFVGIYILMTLNLGGNYSAQNLFISNISGNFLEGGTGFLEVFINNLIVGGFTVLISFLFFSGLIIVLFWNASILAYYIFSIKSQSLALITTVLLLPHGLLEIAGYILFGISGSIFSYKLNEIFINKTRKLNQIFFKDELILLSSAFILILVGAILETA